MIMMMEISNRHEYLGRNLIKHNMQPLAEKALQFAGLGPNYKQSQPFQTTMVL